jgi:hypothetical protein
MAAIRRIELLYAPDCRAVPEARSLIDRLVRESSGPIEVREVIIASLEEAQSLRFPGSPTIRVNGRDVDPGEEAHCAYGLA